MKSAGKARNDGLYRHIRTSKEIIRNLLNDLEKSYGTFLYMSRGMGSLAGLYGNFVIYYFYSERKQGKYAVNPAAVCSILEGAE